MDFLITFAGQYLIYLLPMLLVVFGYLGNISRGRQATVGWFLKLAVALLVAYLAEKLISSLIYLDRPFVAYHFQPLINHLADNSFPSTHATLGAVLALFLWHLNRRLGTVGFLVVLLVSAARVLAGLHYISDILIGLTIGIIAAEVVIRVWRQGIGKLV